MKRTVPLIGGDENLESMFRDSAPSVPELTRQRDAAILAAALKSRRNVPFLARTFRPAMGLACASAVVAGLWFGSPHPFNHPPATTVANGSNSVAKPHPPSKFGRSFGPPATLARLPSPAVGASPEVATTARRRPPVTHARPVWAVQKRTPTTVSGDPARILVVSVHRPPVTATVRTANDSEPGYARAAAWSRGDDGRDSVAEYRSDGSDTKSPDTVFTVASNNGNAGNEYLNVSVSNTDAISNEQKGSDK